MQVSEAVIIKGVREGLLFILDDDVPFSQILTELVERINAQPGFFKGSGVTVNTGRRIIDAPDFDVLYRMLTRNGMHVQAVVSLSAQTRMEKLTQKGAMRGLIHRGGLRAEIVTGGTIRIGDAVE